MSNVHRCTARGSSPIGAAIVGALAAIVSFPVAAAQQRSFVASTGSDMALCTLASPCRSFANAIATTNPGGEVIVLDSAGYGPINIIKPISIIAPAGVYAGITVATGNGVLIDAPGATVVLRGLAINGLGGTHGVRVHDAQRVRIENCTVANMDQDGIHHEAADAEVVVLDTIVRDNGNFGINLVADGSIVLDHVRSEHNDASAMHVGGVAGLVSASVSDSVLVHNAGHGIVVSGSNGQTIRLQVNRSTIAYNAGSGVLALAAATSQLSVTLAGNSVTANGDIGVTLTGTGGGGFVEAALSGNSVTANVHGGVHVHGIAIAHAFGNSMATNGASDLLCDTGSSIDTVGNNLALGTAYTPDTCHLVFPGQ